MKIRPVGSDLHQADGRADVTKLTVTFRNFANAPKRVTEFSVFRYLFRFVFSILAETMFKVFNYILK